MTHCDFGVWSARDEMRHINGDSEPDVISGSDQDQNRRCKKKDKDHMKFLCELYEAHAACGRYFVRELTSEVSSRTAVADLCMFGLAACDDGGPGFVKHKRGDDHQRETSWSAMAKQMLAHA